MRYLFQSPPFEPDGKSTPDLDSDFETVESCPVCSSKDLTPIVTVTGTDGSIGNRTSFCNACEHTFKSRRPTAAWYSDYYRDDWDHGTLLRQQRTIKQQVRSAVRSAVVPKRLISFYDNESKSGHEKGMRILPMLTGIVTGDSYGLSPNPEVRSVLEIGAGYGKAMQLFKQLGLRAVGLETSKARAASCRADGLEVTACSIDDAATTIKGGPYDLLYSAHVFEHILSPTVALRSTASLVREGGYIYIEVPSVAEGEGLIKFAHEVTHVHAFSMTSLARMLALAGFEPLRMRTGTTLHIVGVKQTPTGASPRGFSDQESLTRGAGRLQHGGRVKVAFNNRDLVVTDEAGRVIHRDVARFQRAKSADKIITATLEPGDGPIEFSSPGAASLWIKRQ